MGYRGQRAGDRRQGIGGRGRWQGRGGGGRVPGDRWQGAGTMRQVAGYRRQGTGGRGRAAGDGGRGQAAVDRGVGIRGMVVCEEELLFRCSLRRPLLRGSHAMSTPICPHFHRGGSRLRQHPKHAQHSLQGLFHCQHGMGGKAGWEWSELHLHCLPQGDQPPYLCMIS